jgi:hypothetical protein
MEKVVEKTHGSLQGRFENQNSIRISESHQKTFMKRTTFYFLAKSWCFKILIRMK